MNMKAFILFLLILSVFEITTKWNLTSYDLIGILAIACKIWTDCTKKLKFWNFSLFEEVNIWRKIFAFEIFHFTKNFTAFFHMKRGYWVKFTIEKESPNFLIPGWKNIAYWVWSSSNWEMLDRFLRETSLIKEYVDSKF